MSSQIEVVLAVRQQGVENFNRATMAIKGLAAAWLSLEGAKRVLGFMNESVKMAIEDETQTRKLINALKEKGMATSDNIALYKQFSRERMLATGIQDNEIEQTQQLLIQYGVYGDLVNKTTKSIMDLASAKGIDLISATNLVLSGLESESGGLRGVTLHLDGAAGSAERLASIITILAEKFNNTAESSATTLSQQQRQLELQQKMLGEKLIPVWEVYYKIINKTIDALVDYAYGDSWIPGMTSEQGQGDTSATRRREILSNAIDMATGGKVNLLVAPGGVIKGALTDGEKDAIRKKQDAIDKEKERIFEEKMKMGAKTNLLGIPSFEEWQKKLKTEKEREMERDQSIADLRREHMETLADMEWKLIEEKDRAEKKYLENAISNSLALMSIFKDSSQGAFELTKALGIAQATIASYKAFNEALALPLPPPLPQIQAGIVLALGLGQVSQIASTKFQAFAGGTRFAPGGMSLVGERGPELVNLPRGSQVYNNSQTKNMTTNNSPVINFNITGGGDIAKQIRNAIRSKELDLRMLAA